MRWATGGMNRTTDRDTEVYGSAFYPQGLVGFVLMLSHDRDALDVGIRAQRDAGIRTDPEVWTENLETLVFSDAVEKVLDGLIDHRIVAIPIHLMS